MRYADKITLALSSFGVLDVLISQYASSMGLTYLSISTDTLNHIWVPFVFFIFGLWVSMRLFERFLANKTPYLDREIPKIGKWSLRVLILTAAIVGYKVNLPLVQAIKGSTYESIVENVQGSGLFVVIFSAISSLCTLRITNNYINKEKINTLEILVLTLCALWVYGPRKAALFVAIAPLLLYFLFNGQPGSLSKFKKIFLFSVVILIPPLVDVFRYGDNTSVLSLATQAVGGLAPISSVATETRKYVQSGNCMPDITAMAGNLYYFIPRFIWKAKPDILANSNFLVTTKVLELPDTLSISGSLISEMMLLTCAKSAYWLSIFFFIEGGVVGCLTQYSISRFFGKVGFWSIVLPLSFALYREGVGLYIKDIFTSIILISIILCIRSLVRFASRIESWS